MQVLYAAEAAAREIDRHHPIHLHLVVAVGDPLPGRAEAESFADGLLRGFVPGT